MVQVHVARFSAAPDFSSPFGSVSTAHLQPEHLLLRRSVTEPLFPLLWQCITGRKTANETAVQTALRELQEESSLNPLRMWTLPYVSHWYDTANDAVELVPCFGILVSADATVHLSHEHDCFSWASLDDATEQLVIPAHKHCMVLFHQLLMEIQQSSLSALSRVYEIPLR